MDRLIALLDACVLYPAAPRDFLLHLAVEDLYRPRWTEEIHEEWIRNVLAARPDLRREQLERTRLLMNAHTEDSVISGYEDLIETLSLPDPSDRHVLAAAIHSGADVIVTFNLKDFPAIRHDILHFPARNSAILPARHNFRHRKPPAGRAPGTTSDLPHGPSSG